MKLIMILFILIYFSLIEMETILLESVPGTNQY